METGKDVTHVPAMNTPTLLEEKDIIALFKQAMVELLQERRDLFEDIFLETLEEIGLVAAINEEENSPDVSRSDIFAILERAK